MTASAAGAGAGGGAGPVEPSGGGRTFGLAVAVGAGTAASGLALMVMPRLALRLLGAGRTDPAPFFFRVIGMFMAVSGGQMVEVCRAPEPPAVGLRWALAAKTGAAAMLSGGILSRRLGKQAWAVAAVDAASAALLLRIMRRR
ncbi:MAG TPA: hypothetical protein VNA57_02850 [Acidimicrobiales bacterium]|nr:hypothetical protein [Acidimicrobiales bacterium]